MIIHQATVHRQDIDGEQGGWNGSMTSEAERFTHELPASVRYVCTVQAAEKYNCHVHLFLSLSLSTHELQSMQVMKQTVIAYLIMWNGTSFSLSTGNYNVHFTSLQVTAAPVYRKSLWIIHKEPRSEKEIKIAHSRCLLHSFFLHLLSTSRAFSRFVYRVNCAFASAWVCLFAWTDQEVSVDNWSG